MPFEYQTDGAAIYLQSFATIRAEADLERFVPDDEPIAVDDPCRRDGRSGVNVRVVCACDFLVVKIYLLRLFENQKLGES